MLFKHKTVFSTCLLQQCELYKHKILKTNDLLKVDSKKIPSNKQKQKHMHYFFGLTVHTTGFKLGLHLVFHCSRSPNFVLLHTQSLSYPFTCISFEQKQKGNKSLTAVVIFFEKKN